MITRILLGLIIGVVVGLVVYGLGILLGMFLAPLGAFLQNTAWLFGLVAGAWYVLTGYGRVRI